MSTLNPVLKPGLADLRRAGSLRRTVNSKLLGIWRVLERFGQRRAAGELLRTAAGIQASRPELAASLRAIAQQARTL